MLAPENEGKYSPLVVAIETELKKRHAAGLLLLPDSGALANSTVGIFSDYSGEESTGKYFTYSFLICSWGSLAPFKKVMRELRAEYKLERRRSSSKILRWASSAMPYRRI